MGRRPQGGFVLGSLAQSLSVCTSLLTRHADTMGTDDGLFSLRTLALLVGILASSAVLLALMGRTLWGMADGLGLWMSNPQGALASQVLADPCAFTHVRIELIFLYFFSMVMVRSGREAQFGATLLLESAWEIVENTPYVTERFRQTTAATRLYGRQYSEFARGHFGGGPGLLDCRAGRCARVALVGTGPICRGRGDLGSLDLRQHGAHDLPASRSAPGCS